MSPSSERISTVGRRAKVLPLLVLLSATLVGGVVLLGYRLEAERDRSATLLNQVGRLEAENSTLSSRFGRPVGASRTGSAAGVRTPVLPTIELGVYALQAADPSGSGSPAGIAQRLGVGSGRDVTPGPGALPVTPGAGRASALQDPTVREAMRRQQLAAMHRIYPDLAKALGLSRENADRFIEMQVGNQMRKIDESRQLAASGTVQSSAEMKELGRRLAVSQRDADQELAAQFGPNVLQDWKTYRQGLGVRMELRGLQLELADAGMALTLGQRDDLVAAMVREQQASATAGSKKLTRQAQIEQASDAYQRVANAARVVLSAEQFARFETRQRQRLQVTTAAGEAGRARGAPP